MNAEITLLPVQGEESVATVDITTNPDISMDDLKSVTLPYTRDDITRVDFDGDELTLTLDGGELVLSDFLNEFGEIKEIYTVNGQLLFKDVSDLIGQLGAPAAGNPGVEGSSSIFGFLDEPGLLLADSGLGYRNLRDGLNSLNIGVADLDGDPDNPLANSAPNAVDDLFSFVEDEYGDDQLPGGNVLLNDTDPTDDPLTVVAVNGQTLNGGSIIITLPSGAEIQVNEDGSFVILNPEVYNSLPEGETLTETWTYTASDGVFEDSASSTITVTGTNDAAIIGGDDKGKVREDKNVTEEGYLVDSGALTIDDPDTDESSFDPGSVVSDPDNLGSLTINAAGEWEYQVDNSLDAVQSLGKGDKHVDRFTVETLDGTQHQIKVVIKGRNDGAVIDGDDEGSVKEDVNPNEDNFLTDQGQLTIDDPDAGENAFKPDSVIAAVGNLGSLTLTAAGLWSYQVDNSLAAVQELGEGDSLTDTFTVMSVDGTAHIIDVVINGTNDGAVIGGDDRGKVVEDKNVTETGYLVDSGTLTITDDDAGEAVFDPTSVSGDGGNLGSLTINAAGEWDYQVDNSLDAVQSLPQGGRHIDWFTVQSVDGTEHSIRIVIKGVNDAAEIWGDARGAVKEDVDVNNKGLLIDRGRLRVEDPDQGEDGFDVTSVVGDNGNLGSLVLRENGRWIYKVDNDLDAVQSLPEGGRHIDWFTVASLDGTEHRIKVVINGTNDEAEISGDDRGWVKEDTDVNNAGYLVDRGRLMVDDPDQGQDGFDVTSVEGDVGNLGSLVLRDNGRWIYKVDNDLEAVQSLPEGGRHIDWFTVASLDGTEHRIKVVINGTNDEAVITGDDQGCVKEDRHVNDAGYLKDSGRLRVEDPDQGQDGFDVTSVVGAAGNLGTLVLRSNGKWIYKVENDLDEVQELDEDEVHIDSFTVQSLDGTEHTIKVKIKGVEDEDDEEDEHGNDDCPEIGHEGEDGVYLFSGNAQENAIDGGIGFDILVVDDTTLNFQDKPREYDNFERLHLCGNDNNYRSQTLQKISAEDVIAFTDEDNLLLITGDGPGSGNSEPGDKVKLNLGNWNQLDGTETQDGMEFNVFVSGEATLWVETDVTVEHTNSGGA